MAEFDIYDLSSDDAYGGRSLTEDEEKRLMNKNLFVPEQIRIMNEPDNPAPAPLVYPHAPARPYIPAIHRGLVAPPAPPAPPAWRAPPPAPPAWRAPAPAPPAVPPIPPPVPSRNNDEAIRNLTRQMEDMRSENRRNQEELARERTLRQNREYDLDLYNRLYSWGIGLMPNYYTHIQRKRLQDILAKLIRSELLMHTPAYELENSIRRAIEDSDSTYELKVKAPSRKSRKASPKRKTSKKAKKKTPKKRASSKKRKSTKKPNKKK